MTLMDVPATALKTPLVNAAHFEARSGQSGRPSAQMTCGGMQSSPASSALDKAARAEISVLSFSSSF